MAKTGRLILAVLAGAAVWAILWNVGTQATLALLPELVQAGEPVEHSGILMGYIGYSVLLSVLAGFTTAAAAGTRPMPAVWTLAGIQLALGLGFEISYWSLMPAWYHIVFLALLVPATVYGGTLRRRQAGAPIPA